MAPRGAIFLFVEGEVPETRKTPTMPSRVYFFDALTGEEIICKHTGAQPRAFDAMAASPRTGVAFEDTVWSVEIMSRGKVVTLTAADFDGRLVVVKDWSCGKTMDLRMLVSKEDGFVFLSEVPASMRAGRVERDRFVKTYRDLARGTILGNRRALEWIATGRAARRSNAAA